MIHKRICSNVLNFLSIPVALFGMDGIDGDDHDGHFIPLDDDDDVSTSTDGM